MQRSHSPTFTNLPIDPQTHEPLEEGEGESDDCKSVVLLKNRANWRDLLASSPNKKARLIFVVVKKIRTYVEMLDRIMEVELLGS